MYLKASSLYRFSDFDRKICRFPGSLLKSFANLKCEISIETVVLSEVYTPNFPWRFVIARPLLKTETIFQQNQGRRAQRVFRF